jgi:isopentenyl-diphosphate delta-isomerase
MLNAHAALPRLAARPVVVLGGGIRTGEEIGKAIALGADLAGLALPFLLADRDGRLEGFCDDLARGLARFMRRAGARSIAELRTVRLSIGGGTARGLPRGVRAALPARLSVSPPRR